MTVAELTAEAILEVGLGTHQGMIGLLPPMLRVRAFDDTLLIAVEGLSRGVKIQPLAGVARGQNQEVRT